MSAGKSSFAECHRPGCLISRHPDPHAHILQRGHRRTRVRVQITLAERLWLSRIGAPCALGRKVEPRPEILERLPVIRASAITARPLDRVYPVIFIDALMVKIRDGVVTNRPVYLAIGIDCEGAKQVLGLWVGPSTGESAKFLVTYKSVVLPKVAIWPMSLTFSIW
jgi:hypothetical protein